MEMNVNCENFCGDRSSPVIWNFDFALRDVSFLNERVRILPRRYRGYLMNRPAQTFEGKTHTFPATHSMGRPGLSNWIAHLQRSSNVTPIMNSSFTIRWRGLTLCFGIYERYEVVPIESSNPEIIKREQSETGLGVLDRLRLNGYRLCLLLSCNQPSDYHYSIRCLRTPKYRWAGTVPSIEKWDVAMQVV